uniref:Calpain catalytic domain-containing protein n=1 Tax=Panagrolaimus sp. ES5 TaxID=591445 RepID=A0AC34G2J9_9BILA
MIFGKAQKNQLWVSLIEKGFAKICGNYAALQSGRTIEGMKILTGAPCKEISLYPKENEDNFETQHKFNELWTTLLSSK